MATPEEMAKLLDVDSMMAAVKEGSIKKVVTDNAGITKHMFEEISSCLTDIRCHIRKNDENGRLLVDSVKDLADTGAELSDLTVVALELMNEA